MSSYRSSLKSIAIVSLGALGQLLFQFALQLALAAYFGASEDMDAYVSALALPTVLSTVLVSSLGYAFIPVFMELQQAQGEQRAWEMAGSFGLLLTVISLTLAALAALLARPLVENLLPGFSGDRLEQTIELFRVLAWLILGNTLIGYLTAVYHATGRFTAPALAPVLGTGVTLAYVVMMHRTSGIFAVAVAVVLGALVNVAVQLPLILRKARWKVAVDPATRKCLRLLVPLILGAAYVNLDPLIDRYLASSMPTGSIAYLGYAWRLLSGLLLLSSSGLSIVAFPALASHSAAGREHEFRAEFAYALRFLCFLTIPVVLGLLLFSRPVIRDLLQRGAFTAADTSAVARLLALYSGVLIAASFGGMAAKVFYAWGDTRTPTLIGAVGFTIGAAIKILLAPYLGIDALVAATSAYHLFGAGTSLALIATRSGAAAFSGLSGTIFRSLVGATAAAATAHLLLQLPFRFTSIGAALLAAITYGVVMLLLKDEFALKLWEFVRRQGSKK